jgi:type IV pilus assembly protein PilP
LYVTLLSLTLAGCGDDGLEEVRHYVRTVHADMKPRVDPAPELKLQESFAYAANALPDPFSISNLKPQGLAGGKGGSGPRPDPNRRKEALEDYPLDSLKMVGTLTRGKQSWVIIQAPDGTVHRVTKGNHLGQNFGMITKVAEEKIDVVELIQGSMGDWVEREATLTLVE